MTTKQEQLDKMKTNLEALQSSMQKLKQEIQKEETEKKQERVFGFLPEAGSGKSYYGLIATGSSVGFGLFQPNLKHAICGGTNNYKGLFWKTEQEAQSFADAMNTFLELRTLEGVKGFEVAKPNWVISINHTLTRFTANNELYGCDFLSPAFKTEDLAEQAIQTIGEGRLKHMFKVLSGMEK